MWNLPQMGSHLSLSLPAALATSGDQIQPGDTELTLILCGARSSAMFLVRMLTAPLLAA